MSDSESSSSVSSSSESESNANPPDAVNEPCPDTAPKKSRKRKAPEKVVKGGKCKKSDKELRNLAKECFQHFMSVNTYPNYPPYQAPYFRQASEDEVSVNVSGELFSDDDNDKRPADPCANFELPLSTVLKEPSVSKSSKDHIELLNSAQHFNTPEWCDVRYSDVQKSYCSTPGFVELECNDEVKPFDRFPNLVISERSYAALTQALLKQRDATQASFQALLKWASETNELSSSTIKDKVNEIFIEGKFNKISGDLLQLTCGHRADTIEQRRDGILRYVKDKYVRSNLRKIPPTCDSLFSKDMFTSAIEKAGGMNKVFWPSRGPSQKTNWPAAQAGPSSAEPPAQGYQPDLPKAYYGRPAYSMPPAQGAYPMYFPTQGMLPVPTYYPPQGFGHAFPGQNKRFAQNHSNRMNRPDTRASRQKSQYDDGHGKIQSKNQNINSKNFRGKRKF
ncbi:hypothetical protein JYU34_018439 [Plutella xylostella]|uniref:Uncharacterized protein n=1 Tax=Plutella xylostella TaxID=51655 RepID=A0ABQ7PXW2_PLUXY|nr:hypothetical protein JYU34_018439 [Plutella xylostella]